MPSSAELIADVASEAAVTQKDVKSVIEALTKIAGRELKKNGVFSIPYLAKFKEVKKKAREGGVKKCLAKSSRFNRDPRLRLSKFLRLNN